MKRTKVNSSPSHPAGKLRKWHTRTPQFIYPILLAFILASCSTQPAPAPTVVTPIVSVTSQARSTEAPKLAQPPPGSSSAVPAQPTGGTTVVPGSLATAVMLPASCRSQDSDRVPLMDLAGGYCLLYPAHFLASGTSTGTTNLLGSRAAQDVEAAVAELVLVVEGDSNGRSLQQIVDERVKQAQAQSIVGPVPITRTQSTLAGEPAEVVEGLPGIAISRQLFAVHQNTLYRLVALPVDPEYPQVQPEVEQVWQSVITSFAFLPPATLQAFRGCPTSTPNSSIYVNATDGYCLAYPSNFVLGDIHSPGIANLYGPPLDNSPEPVAAGLSITTEPANGRSLAQITEAAVRQAPGSTPITRTQTTLGGEPAEVVAGLPGRTGSRQMFAVHGEQAYHLTVYPIDPALPQVAPDAETLWQTVAASFTFWR